MAKLLKLWPLLTAEPLVENLIFLILDIHFLISDSRLVYNLIFYAIHITHQIR